MPSLFTRLLGANDRARPASSPAEAPREHKHSRALKLLAMHSTGAPRWTMRSHAEMTRQGYERNAVVYRCVRMIVEAAASVPWLMYRGREEIVDHPLLDLVARPNPFDTSVSLIEAICSNLLLHGNAYVEAAFVDNEPRELYALRPDRVSVATGRNGWPAAYVYRAMGDEVRFDMRGEGIEPILHIKLFSPLDDVYGFAPLCAAQVPLDVHNAASAWNKALLDNSARPSGALVYAGPDGAHLSDEQFARLKQELEENFSGAINAGRPLLLEGGLDWKALSLSPKDMDFNEAKAGAAREIALAFGAPPLLLGLPGDNTFSNYQEANRAFWRQTVLPLVARVQRSFEAWLQPGFGPFRFDYNADRLEALADERAMEWERVGKAPFLTIDEQREAVGYAAMPKDALALFGKREQGLERRYAPDQPRVPAGNPDGGQWTSGGGGGDGGGGGGSSPSNDVALTDLPGVASDAVDSLIARVQERFFNIDLAEDEAQGGHALARHVGRSKEQLIRRADRNRIGIGKYGIWEDRFGSFTSLMAANAFVNEALSRSRTTVDDVIAGKASFAKLEAWFGRPTGFESYRRRFHDQVNIRDTFGVRVVVIRDPLSPRGFRIKTAYPINKD
jgi:HK97 family phage portal protein